MNTEQKIEKSDLEFVGDILPNHYEIKETKGGILCRSRIGIEDDKDWESFKKSARQYFGDRLLEFYHNTCANHVNFIIYL